MSIGYKNTIYNKKGAELWTTYNKNKCINMNIYNDGEFWAFCACWGPLPHTIVVPLFETYNIISDISWVISTL